MNFQIAQADVSFLGLWSEEKASSPLTCHTFLDAKNSMPLATWKL